MTNLIANLWAELSSPFKTFSPVDLLDIAIVAYLIYQTIKLVRETRAAQLLKGIGMLLLLYLLADGLKLKTMQFLTQNVLQVGLFAMLVVFQPELRRALEQVGRSRIGKFHVFSSGTALPDEIASWQRFVNALIAEVPALSRQKIGALVVIEQSTKLGEIIKTGTVIDADPSGELIGNVFFPNSPLHDGAMIVREGRVYAAGCFLPLSDNSEISRELGTRHRAALGMSEASDAIVVVVSEETGMITVCRDGKLNRGISVQELEKLLTAQLVGIDPVEENEKTSERRKGKKA